MSTTIIELEEDCLMLVPFKTMLYKDTKQSIKINLFKCNFMEVMNLKISNVRQ